MWQGGNQWSAWDSFLSFFRHVAKLNLPQYEAYQHWETAAIRGGPRIMHPDFCMVSDRPERLTVDERNRPHCSDGPFCRWRDGSALYAVHGVYTPAWIVERPQDITVVSIEAEQNAEVKRVMIERFGHGRYITEAKIKPVHTDDFGTLYRREADEFTVVRVVDVVRNDDGTEKVHYLPVHPELRPMLADGDLGEPQKMTARNAVASSFGMTGAQYTPVAQS